MPYNIRNRGERERDSSQRRRGRHTNGHGTWNGARADRNFIILVLCATVGIEARFDCFIPAAARLAGGRAGPGFVNSTE